MAIKLNIMNTINTESLIEDLIDFDPMNDKTDAIDQKYACTLSFEVEKHNTLQYTYFYEVVFVEGIYNVEIECGINNGTQVNHQAWNDSTKKSTREVEVVKDVIFSEKAFNLWYNGNEESRDFVRRKAIAIFGNNKTKLLKLHKNQNYDDYVTGGGTNIISRFYKDEYRELRDKGVFWEYKYETVEADCNFV